MGNSVEERRFQRRVISKSGGYAALKGRSSTPFPRLGVSLGGRAAELRFARQALPLRGVVMRLWALTLAANLRCARHRTRP